MTSLGLGRLNGRESSIWSTVTVLSPSRAESQECMAAKLGSQAVAVRAGIEREQLETGVQACAAFRPTRRVTMRVKVKARRDGKSTKYCSQKLRWLSRNARFGASGTVIFGIFGIWGMGCDLCGASVGRGDGGVVWTGDCLNCDFWGIWWMGCDLRVDGVWGGEGAGVWTGIV